jgi:hypothetical protein
MSITRLMAELLGSCGPSWVQVGRVVALEQRGNALASHMTPHRGPVAGVAAAVMMACVICGKRPSDGVDALLLLAVGVELLEIGEQVIGLLLILQPGEGHFRARNLGFRILDIFAEGRLIPSNSGILVGGGI